MNYTLTQKSDKSDHLYGRYIEPIRIFGVRIPNTSHEQTTTNSHFVFRITMVTGR